MLKNVQLTLITFAGKACGLRSCSTELKVTVSQVAQNDKFIMCSHSWEMSFLVLYFFLLKNPESLFIQLCTYLHMIAHDKQAGGHPFHACG